MSNETNHDLTPAAAETNTTTTESPNVQYSVNIGPPGNMTKVLLDSSKQWTVADVLNEAGLDASNREIRVGGDIASMDTPITGDQTILLVRPVRGNTAGA